MEYRLTGKQFKRAMYIPKGTLVSDTNCGNFVSIFQKSEDDLNNDYSIFIGIDVTTLYTPRNNGVYCFRLMSPGWYEIELIQP